MKKNIRIYTTHGVASSILPNIVSYFCDLYPDIKVILLTQYSPKYLSHDESVVRSDFIEQKNIKKIKVIDIEMGFYASPEYMEKFGNPDSFENFSNHRYLFSFGNRQSESLGPDNIYIETNITSSNIEFSYKMCLNGQGIIELPTIYPGIDRLVKVLKNAETAKHSLYLAYIESQKPDSPNILFSKVLKEYKKLNNI